MQAIEVRPIYTDTAIVIADVPPIPPPPIPHQIPHQIPPPPIPHHRQNTDRLLILAYVAKHVKFIQRRKVYVPRF